MNKPALSVIIPTCNRAVPLAACLRTLVEQDCPELEILVSDNAGGPETAQVLASFDDPRIRSLRVEKRLGMADHFEFALGHARGEWVTFLGDDDGMLPGGAARFLELAGRDSVDAINSTRCDYIWPEAKDGQHGVLTVHGGKGYETRGSREWLTSVVMGRKGYGALPWIYIGGFVQRRVMERIKDRMGRYFSSVNPDAFSAIAVASVTSEYGYSRDPFSIGGTCGQSNGSKWLLNTRIETECHEFFVDSTMEFHPLLGDGNIYSMPLNIYESFLQTESLRDYVIETDLSEQLLLAVLAQKKKMGKAVEDYCRKLADTNELDFDEILSRSRIPRFRAYAAKKLSRLTAPIVNSGANGRRVVKSPKLSDVYLASIEAGEILSGQGKIRSRA